MKKIATKVYVVIYRVYNFDQEGTRKSKPFDFIDFEHDTNVFEFIPARLFYSLLLILFK